MMNKIRAVGLAFGVVAFVGVSAFVLTGAGDPPATPDPTRPQYTADGKLILPDPKIFHEWVHLGTPLTPNDQNGGMATFPEFHEVYVPQWAWDEFKKNGVWPDGTIVAKELVLIGDREAPSGKGYFEGGYNGLDVSVKDSTRVPAGTADKWLYYDFNHKPPPYLAEVAAEPEAACSSCHEAYAGPDADYMFIKYYPIAKEAKASLAH